MSLELVKLSFTNFRNYPSLQLDQLGKMVVFVGENAIGKTNILEGISLLSTQTSFRSAQAAQLVLKGADFARVDGWVEDVSRNLQITLELKEGRQRRFLNGKPKKIGEMRGVVPSVAFTPDDLELSRGASGPRRNALDKLGAQLSANHHTICSDYRKTVQSKNKLLKDAVASDLLDSYNEVLVMVGAQLTCYRAALFMRLGEYMATYYRSISRGRECLEVSYTPSWVDYDADVIVRETPQRDEARANLHEALRRNREEELRRHSSLVGPHADHLDFFIDGNNAAFFASQGQKRSIVLAFKLSETALVKELLGQNPLLLLDDVVGELDEERTKALFGYIAGDLQTFITTTSLHYFSDEMLSQALVFKLPFNELDA